MSEQKGRGGSREKERERGRGRRAGKSLGRGVY